MSDILEIFDEIFIFLEESISTLFYGSYWRPFAMVLLVLTIFIPIFCQVVRRVFNG